MSEEHLQLYAGGIDRGLVKDATVGVELQLGEFLQAVGDLEQGLFCCMCMRLARRWRSSVWGLKGAIAGGMQSKFAAQVVERYEQALAAEARRLGMDGVICGHIHFPRIRPIGGVLYVNDGDWVRPRSRLLFFRCTREQTEPGIACKWFFHMALRHISVGRAQLPTASDLL